MERHGDRGGPAHGDRRGQPLLPARDAAPSALHAERSTTWSLCFCKGVARYYGLEVEGRPNPDAAWYYPKPSPLARKIKDHVAFWQGVTVEGAQEPSRSGADGV
ncbi:DUF427 domain-containing protein [Streptomyces sp. NBC_01481]|uniref:DUF427 domain-containing protein n=1 Tax=Streptomyces sp. NBC_01481 TaxID=2975869 RepID=UPI00225B5D06|nr:DUF427 domain-containing protein [Streptomyces sp. NBC_01481]MCX4581530.1 DUF427 domain-containing protein [Streptomyces sp. NBC_01481]